MTRKSDIKKTNGSSPEPKDDFEAKLAELPRSPGVYLMKDDAGKIIYVGKAKSLRDRVRSYVNETDTRPSVKFLMSRTADFDYILTDTEKEALLLENTLIKRHAPRYNVRMKDDKSYVCIRIDVQNRFPRVTIGRRFRKDAARFFGPYSSAKEVRRAVRLVHDVFPLRTCSEAVFKSRRRPCIQYEIGRCPGPCCGLIPETEYRRIVDSVILFLKGRNKELVDKIRADMKEASARLDFERAAVLRDRIAAIETTLEKQKVAGAVGGENRDVFGFHRDGDTIAVTVLAFRSGQMSATDSFVFDRARQPVDEVMASFLPQFYGSGRRFVPREVMLPDMPEDVSGLEEFLSDLRGGKVRVYVPRRGEKVKLVNMAERNAAAAIVRHRHRAADTETALRELRDRLNLTRIPARIECFDISNTSGTLAVGSMAAFTNGEPDKKRYRRYRVKTVKGSDDYAMMREVLMRRYRRAIDEDDMPDLVVVDGGLGQINVARTVFDDLGVGDVNLIGIAKGRGRSAAAARHGKSRRVDEHIFVSGRKNPVRLGSHSPAIHLLQRVRDEAHRFAVTYHRRLRAKKAVAGELESIPGIGPNRQAALLRRFGSVARLRTASADEIASLPEIPRGLAKRIVAALKPDRVPE